MNSENTQTFVATKPLSELKHLLRGRPYMRAVRAILPTLTPWAIRNAVNEKNENQQVVAALEIAIAQMDEAEKQANRALAVAAEEAGLAVG